MTEKENTTIPTNEEVIVDLTKKLETSLNTNHDGDQNPEAVATNLLNEDIPEGFDKPDSETDQIKQPDDFVDEEQLKILDENLTEVEKEQRLKEALDLKKKGNEQFKSGLYLESVNTYTEAIRLCPLKNGDDRSIFYANRAASKISLGRKESAIEDCTKAIELNDRYIRAYLRRAKLYEETDKLDESLSDYKKVLEFDNTNKDALLAQHRLPPLIAEKNEKLKEEMLGKLKDLGNMFLKPFGLSTENFKLNQDAKTGGYSVNFSQNK